MARGGLEQLGELNREYPGAWRRLPRRLRRFIMDYAIASPDLENLMEPDFEDMEELMVSFDLDEKDARALSRWLQRVKGYEPRRSDLRLSKEGRERIETDRRYLEGLRGKE